MKINRKPKGSIKILIRHRTPRGKIFLKDEIYEYYDIIERRGCNCCKKQGKVPCRFYKTRKGLVPLKKAEIYEI